MPTTPSEASAGTPTTPPTATTSLADAVTDATPATPGASEPPGEAAADPVPEGAYELTPPPGFDAIDAEMLAEAEPLFRQYGIGQAGAQKLTELAGKLTQQLVSKTVQDAQAVEDARIMSNEKLLADQLVKDGYTAWDPASRDHPAKRDAVAGMMALVGDDRARAAQLFQAFDASGASALILPLLARVGRAAASDTFQLGGATTQRRDAASILYPDDVRR